MNSDLLMFDGGQKGRSTAPTALDDSFEHQSSKIANNIIDIRNTR